MQPSKSINLLRLHSMAKRNSCAPSKTKKTCSNAIIINSKWIRLEWLNDFPFIFGFYFWQLKASASSVLVFSLMHSENKYKNARTHPIVLREMRRQIIIFGTRGETKQVRYIMRLGIGTSEHTKNWFTGKMCLFRDFVKLSLVHARFNMVFVQWENCGVRACVRVRASVCVSQFIFM